MSKTYFADFMDEAAVHLSKSNSCLPQDLITWHMAHLLPSEDRTLLWKRLQNLFSKVKSEADVTLKSLEHGIIRHTWCPCCFSINPL